MQIKLIHESSQASWSLKPNRPYVVGSSEECDISLEDAGLAPQQFRFEFDAQSDQWFVENLDSGSSSFLNGSKLVRSAIQGESRVSVGQARFMVMPVSLEPVGVGAGFSQSAATSRSDQSKASFYSTAQVQSAYRRENIYNQGRSQISSLNSSAHKVATVAGGWFNLEDPNDGAGKEIGSFGFSKTYKISLANLGGVREKLYQCTLETLQSDRGIGSQAQVIAFQDFETGEQRPYISVRRTSIHGVRSTLLLRFLNYGEYLYVGINFYVLNEISWWKLGFAMAPTLGLFPLCHSIVTNYSNDISAIWYGLVVMVLLFSAVIIVPLWGKFFKRLRIEPSNIALRQQFPASASSLLPYTFDYDDVIVFGQSTLMSVIDSLKSVFQEEGLPLDSLNEYEQRVINNTTVINNSGVMQGNALGYSSKVGNVGLTGKP